MYMWGKGRATGRVRLFVGNRGSGRVHVSPGRVQEKWPVDNSDIQWQMHKIYKNISIGK